MNVGWKIESGSNAPYSIKEDFNLTEQETKLYSTLIERLKNKATDSFAKSAVHSLLKSICEEKRLMLRMESAKRIERLAELNLGGNGILDILLADDSLEEISINGCNSPIRVYKRGVGWLNSNCCITDTEFAINMINKMARGIGRRISYGMPALNAHLPDGSRLHATISPLNPDGFEITIRKFAKNPISIADLIKSRTISADSAAFLCLCGSCDISLMICGNTGSGKTTFLNALFSFVPLDDRVIIAEETPEISIPHRHKISLVANPSLGINMEELVHNTLRMRPDRVIIGEVRTKPEVLALFESLRAGQAKGCFATFHSQNAIEMINRMGGMGIERNDLSAIDLVVVLRRITQIETGKNSSKEIRRVTEISEIAENGRIRQIFRYDAKGDRLIFDENAFLSSKLIEKIGLNYQMGKEELLEEFEMRKNKLNEVIKSGRNVDLIEFTEIIQNQHQENKK